MDSAGGEASSPALFLLYFLLFSAHRTDQATGQPQRTLKCPWNKELSAEYNVPPHLNSGSTCSLGLRVATSFSPQRQQVFSWLQAPPISSRLKPCTAISALMSVSGPISKAIKDVCMGMPCLVVSYKPETKGILVSFWVFLSYHLKILSGPLNFQLPKFAAIIFSLFFFLKIFLMWTIFKAFTEFVTILLLFYVCLFVCLFVCFFWLQDMWYISSPSRGLTHTSSKA